MSMGLRQLAIEDDQKETYSCFSTPGHHRTALELTTRAWSKHRVPFIKPCELEIVWLSECLCMCAKARGQLWLSFLW